MKEEHDHGLAAVLEHRSVELAQQPERDAVRLRRRIVAAVRVDLVAREALGQLVPQHLGEAHRRQEIEGMGPVTPLVELVALAEAGDDLRVVAQELPVIGGAAQRVFHQLEPCVAEKEAGLRGRQ
jgi:hypothetical protein